MATVARWPEKVLMASILTKPAGVCLRDNAHQHTLPILHRQDKEAQKVRSDCPARPTKGSRPGVLNPPCLPPTLRRRLKSSVKRTAGPRAVPTQIKELQCGRNKTQRATQWGALGIG